MCLISQFENRRYYDLMTISYVIFLYYRDSDWTVHGILATLASLS